MPSGKLQKSALAILLCFAFLCGNTQQSNWLAGLWKEKTDPRLNSKNLIIDSVKGSSFTGITIFKQKGLPVIIDIKGSYTTSRFVFKGITVLSGETSQKDYTPQCLSCVTENNLTIKEDSLLLTSRIIACNDSCNGVDIYYRLLCEFDEATQLYLVKNFGSGSNIQSFVPCKETPEALEEKKRLKQIEDSTTNLVLIAQLRKKRLEERLAFEADEREKLKQDSLKSVASYKQKYEKGIADSLQAIAKLKEQRKLDSLNEAAAKIKQQHIEDSIAAVKKRQQQIADSLQVIAKLKEQRRLDSLNEIAAKIKQQHIEDSIAAVKKRQQQIADSLQVIAKIKEQRRLDSLNEIAAVKKRQQEIADSLRAIAKIKEQLRLDSLNEITAKIKQQHIEDSIAAVKKRQQQIADSLQVIVKLKEQRKLDSLNEAAAKIKQQHIEDSIAAVKKRQQQIADSLQAIAKLKEQQKLNAVNAQLSEKRKKQIADSLENIAAIKQQRTKDSLSKALAAKEQRAILDSLETARAKPSSIKDKVLEERGNVLLGAYHITTPDIVVDLFDNGEIDGDRISVYHNNRPVVNNELLSTKPITFTIHADALNRQHEFILVADNLGDISPNSALMRITVGKETYKLFVKTDLSTNAKIIFYYDGD
ncbi:hypothetical protein [Parafilimonas sp.]|uniref:hypothetical protein n=1 Tax=Parafilimonas sp. TaxID=1969739 RepID=UPI003F7D7047